LTSRGKKCRITADSRVLVIRTDRIGDVILSTPVLTALKRRFPTVFAAVLVRPYTQQIVEDHPHIDQILLDPIEDKHKGVRGLWRLRNLLHRGRFDIALLLHPTFRLALAVWLARIPCRVGTAFRFYSLLFNHRIRQHRRTSGMHEADLNLQFAAAVGAPVDSIELCFAVPEREKQRAQQLLDEAKVVGPLVVIHPGSGGSAQEWPAQKFAALADRIVREWGWQVVVTGGEADQKQVNQMAAAVSVPIVRLDRRLDIKTLAALLQRADLVVANSTGPLHLAAAVGSPVVGLYCPLPACHPQRWGPYHQPEGVVLPPPENCLVDSRGRCRKGECMDAISVEQVWQRLQDRRQTRAQDRLNS